MAEVGRVGVVSDGSRKGTDGEERDVRVESWVGLVCRWTSALGRDGDLELRGGLGMGGVSFGLQVEAAFA